MYIYIPLVALIPLVTLMLLCTHISPEAGVCREAVTTPVPAAHRLQHLVPAHLTANRATATVN